MYIGKTPIVGNFQKCDSLNASATADYTLQVGSTNVSPESVIHMIVSLNGVIQEPGATGGFTVSGSTLSFTSALTSNDTIDFVILLGNVLDIGTPSDDTCGAAQIKDDLISGTTELTISPAATDEILLSDAGTLKRTDVSVFGNAPAFKVTLSGNQTLNDDTLTRVAWDTEEYDTHSAFASNIFTVPANEGGKYVFEFHVFGDDIDDGDIWTTYLELDGTQVVGSVSSTAGPYSTNNCPMNNTITVTCTAGQTVEVVSKHQGTGGSQEIRSNNSFFSGYKLVGV